MLRDQSSQSRRSPHRGHAGSREMAPGCRTSQEHACLPIQGARSRAEGCNDIHLSDISGRCLIGLMAYDVSARAQGDRGERHGLMQCHHPLARQLQTGDQRARHGRSSP